jgi:hypothetical protein
MSAIPIRFDQFFIGKLINEIHLFIGWKMSIKSDCERLSKIICSSGHGYISTSTIYRIFFNHGNHKPYKHTMDSLCRFVGYKDSLEFIEKNQGIKEDLQRMGLQEFLPGNKTLFYHCIEGQAIKPMKMFFEETMTLPVEYRKNVALILFDTLQVSSTQRWFFEEFSDDIFIRLYLFEYLHDPSFRIKHYDFGLENFYKNIGKMDDAIPFQDYIFVQTVRFRHFYLAGDYEKAFSFGSQLYDKVILGDSFLNSSVHIWPFARFHAYRLFFMEMVGTAPGKMIDYAQKLLWMLRNTLPYLSSFSEKYSEQRIFCYCVAEAFSHTSIPESLHMELKLLIKEIDKISPQIQLNKPLKHYIPYLDPNILKVLVPLG